MPLATGSNVVRRPPTWNNTNKNPHPLIVRRRTHTAAIGSKAAGAVLRSHPYNPRCGT